MLRQRILLQTVLVSLQNPLVASMLREATSWHHYVSVAEACSLQSGWQRALWLLFHAAPHTDAVDYRFSAAISACKNALVAGEGSTAGGAGGSGGGLSRSCCSKNATLSKGKSAATRSVGQLSS